MKKGKKELAFGNVIEYALACLKGKEEKGYDDKFYSVKGRAFAAEADPRAKPGAPAAVDGHFFTYDMTAGKSYNITKDVPASFVNEDNDHNLVKPPEKKEEKKEEKK